MRTHITVKHKQAKTFPSKVKDKPLDGETHEGEFNFDEDDLTKSTQITAEDEAVTTEDILRKYDGVEVEDESVSIDETVLPSSLPSAQIPNNRRSRKKRK